MDQHDRNICQTLHNFIDSLCGRNAPLWHIAKSLGQIAEDVHLIRLKYNPLSSDVVGINVNAVQQGEKMSVAMRAKSVTIVKKTALKGAIQAHKAGMKLDPGKFYIIDGGTGTFQVTGLDSATPPNPVDISGIATLTVVSDDPNITVTSVTGMTAVLTVNPASGAGSGVVHFTATANDGSWTYTFDATVTYDGGTISGIVVTQTS